MEFADSKVETWTQDEINVTQRFSEIDLGQQRRDTEQVSNITNHVPSRGTSVFSSYQVDSIHGSGEGILQDDRSATSNASRFDPNQHAASSHAGPALSGSRREVSNSTRQEETYLHGGHDQLGGCYDDDIPAHCRMDTFHSQPVNYPRPQESQSDPAWIGNSKHGTSKQTSRQEITATPFKPDFGNMRTDMENSSPMAHSRTQNKSRNTDQARQKRSSDRTRMDQPVRASKKTMPSADVDEEKRRRVEANLSKFTKKIDAEILLPHLKPCLLDQHYTHIRRQCETGQSPLKVNQLLWSYLKRAPNWWWYLELALEKCGLNDLLGIMQG